MSFFRNLFKRRAAAVVPATARGITPAPVLPRPEPASTPARPAVPMEDCLSFPLKNITDLFPQELRTTLRKQPSEHVKVHIPRALITPQLAAGAVRITFDQLRAATPEIFFHPENAPTDAKVLLPLEAVLRQMMPSQRDDQRQPAIPVNIPSVFLKSGQSRPGDATARGARESWYSQRRPSYDAQPEPAPEETAPAKAAQAANGKKPHSLLATDRPRRAPEPEAASPARLAPTSAPVPIPVPEPVVQADSLAVPLSAVMSVLPPEIGQALNGYDPASAAFLIPLAELEARIRTGKLLFKWGQLQGWCTVGLAASVAPDLDIDMPLAAVVPLFMAARGTPDTARKQLAADARIPDIFAKSQSTDAATHEAPAAPSPPAAEAQPSPAPVPRGPSSPKDIIGRIRALDGVSGAFIATADGLLVAGDVAAADDNVLAAFAPTVFVQLAKYVDMARLGTPESVDIHLAGASIHVRKTGKLFLGVLTPAGHPLPTREITDISSALQPQAS